MVTLLGVVVDGVIVNVVENPDDHPIPQSWLDAHPTVSVPNTSYRGKTWDGANFGDPADTRSLAIAKQQAKDRITAARYDAEVAGTIFNGWPVQSDRDSRPTLTAMYTAARDGMRVDGSIYKFADGVFHPLTNTQAMQMALTVLSFVQAQYDAEQTKWGLIDACSTNAEADAIQWG